MTESHPAGYRLAARPDAVDAVAFEVLAAQLGLDPNQEARHPDGPTAATRH